MRGGRFAIFWAARGPGGLVSFEKKPELNVIFKIKFYFWVLIKMAGI